MTSLTRAQLGARGEQLAVDHLRSLGLQVLVRNWRCRHGELDLVAADPATGTVVFVEVKTRRTGTFGGPAQAVTPRKIRRLRRLAGLWLAAQQDTGQARWSAIRIDVIGVYVGGRSSEIVHLQGVG